MPLSPIFSSAAVQQILTQLDSLPPTAAPARHYGPPSLGRNIPFARRELGTQARQVVGNFAPEVLREPLKQTARPFARDVRDQLGMPLTE